MLHGGKIILTLHIVSTMSFSIWSMPLYLITIEHRSLKKFESSVKASTTFLGTKCNWHQLLCEYMTIVTFQPINFQLLNLTTTRYVRSISIWELQRTCPLTNVFNLCYLIKENGALGFNLSVRSHNSHLMFNASKSILALLLSFV